MGWDQLPAPRFLQGKLLQLRKEHRSALRGETALPGVSPSSLSAGDFSHKLQRLSSNGTMSSSEELEEKDEPTAPFEQST